MNPQVLSSFSAVVPSGADVSAPFGGRPHLQPLDPQVMAQLSLQGPRYTSYPTADRFVEAFGPEQYIQALQQSSGGAGGAGGAAAPLSVYVHIPFCESVCYYCACNKVVTKRKDKAEIYLAALLAEIDLNVAHLGRGRSLSQLHLGGGTPTFFSDDQLERLLLKLQDSFRFLPGGEYALEVDPRTVSAERIKRLWNMGFNRLSLGVQDFDPAVQLAVHRVQPFEEVAALLQAARDTGFKSINMDLIYGLPLQTPASFSKTLAQVTELRPDRIALYAYAHLPQRFKPQRRIDATLLPEGSTKLGMLVAAIEHFQAQGYDYIGMDHFALPQDPLAVARRQGLLHRNFQGYSTHPDSDLVALGVSAIGRVGVHYSQNAKTLEEYQDAISTGQFAVQRGLTLTRDDLVRRAVIMAIMCQGRVDIESIELAYLINFKDYFSAECVQLNNLVDQGLVVLEPDSICVTDMGWYVVRAVAMVFDRYLQANKNMTQFSKII